MIELDDLDEKGNRTVTCQCGVKIRTHWPLEQIHHTCPLGKCTYQGEQVRTTPCTSCTGRIELKVFSCQLHKEATLKKKVDGIACCLGCKDFSSTP